MFDDKKSGELRQIKHEIADLSHNLKRVMEQLGIEYERNPLLEISTQALAALKNSDDQLAVKITAHDRDIDEATATEGLRQLKPRLGLGELNC